jgi:hypothetical protein
VFHGCVSNATALMRVVKSASSCQKPKTVRRNGKRVSLPGEFAVAWNQQGRQGIQGNPGQNGQNGLQGQPGQDATKLFASIAVVGTSVHVEYGNGVTGVSRSSAGRYVVTFNRSVANCAVQDTVGFGNPNPHGGVISSGLATSTVTINPIPSTNPARVEVDLNEPSGTTQPNPAPADNNFMITAFC